MSFDIAASRGTNLSMAIAATTDGPLKPLKDKKVKTETNSKNQAPDDLIRQKGKAPDKSGKIVASDYVQPARPAIAVKTPSFKAPKTIGKKPAMIASINKVAAGGAGSGRHITVSVTDDNRKKIHTSLITKGFNDPIFKKRTGMSLYTHPNGGSVSMAYKGKVSAGGPGSGRKPEAHHPDTQGKMDRLHKQLTNKGYDYKPHLSVANKDDTMTRHVYMKKEPGMKSEIMHINERKNGYHNIS